MTEIQFIDYYDRNEAALYNFARKLTRAEVDAQDLVQETAIKAFRALHTFKQGTSFKSWAFTILKNTFISKYHRRKKRNVVNNPIEDFTFALENQYAVRNDAISRIRMKEIKASIDNLSYKSKLPFMMYVEGYKYNEIADTLNIPVGTVKSRINFARTKLKNTKAIQEKIAA